MRRIYLDYAASTPVDTTVERAMRPHFSKKFGNPGSLHSFGREAIAAVDEARETIAKAINADSGEIIFTGSATEANNLALRGIIKALRINGLTNSQSEIRNPRIIISSIEHESVLETAEDLSAGGGSAFGGKKDGVEAIYLPVDKNGLVDPAALKKFLNRRTVLVSVMYANNEIGAIQPIAEISRIIRKFRGEKKYPLFHSDAAQAFQFLDCGAGRLGVDLMTLSSHKIYGPKGVGALYMRGYRVKPIANSAKKSTINPIGYTLNPIITGGGQEFGLRSGTENVPAIVGFAKAAELISNSRELENKRIASLKKYFWKELKKSYPKIEINGCPFATELQRNYAERIAPRPSRYEKGKFDSNLSSGRNTVEIRSLPNILNVYFPDYSSEYILTKLDINGLAVSSGSACRSRALSPSYVIKALGHSEERAKHSVRFSFGRPTTSNEIKKALAIIKNCLQ